MLFIAFGFSANADDSFFDDNVVFDDTEEEFEEWSDDSDIFGDESIDDEKSLAWLNLGVSQKWGFNPASSYSTTKERTELTLGTSGSVSNFRLW